MKVWDRTRPLKSIGLIAIGVFFIFEIGLLFSGKWMFVGQYRYESSDASGGGIFYIAATRTWPLMDCTYWTGRSVQTITWDGEYTEIPTECAFIETAR